MKEHRIVTQRTARFFSLGTPSDSVREVWFVLHGYGQLAPFFLRHFQDIAHPARYIIAPEALSRFYWDHSTGRVGASWMTKADRLQEIQDYVAYLNSIYHAVFSELRRDQVTVHILGFSQGATTACRWLCLGQAQADQFTLWAGGLPHDLNWETGAPILRQLDLRLVLGSEDEFISIDQLEQQESILKQHNIEWTRMVFEGAHRIHQPTLQTLADDFETDDGGS